MNWFSYSLIAVLFFSLYEILSRKIAVDSENPQALTVIFNAATSLLAPLLFLLEAPKTINISLFVLFLTILDLIVWGIFGRFEYLAHKHVEASVLSVVVKLALVVAFLLSVIFYGEKLLPEKIFGILLVIAASVLLTIKTDNKRLNFKKGIIFSLLTAIFLGISWTLDKTVSVYYGVGLFSIMSFFSPVLINSVIPPIHLRALSLELKRAKLANLAILAFVNLIGYAALIKGLMMGEVSRVTTISTATIPFVLLFSFIFLKERSNIKTKVLCCILSLAGIYLLR